MLETTYPASLCPVKPQGQRGAQQGARQSRQRTTCIMRTGTARQRISGEFFEVMDHILNALWTIRFELLLTAAALGIGALGLWHEYSAQRRVSRMAQECKDGRQKA